MTVEARDSGDFNRRTEIGRHIFGCSAIALGMLGLYFRDFATVWQPVPLGLPGYRIAAIAAALLFLLSGAALQWRAIARFGGIGTALLYAIFTALWLPHIAGSPRIFANWGATAEELALLSASVALVARYAAVADGVRQLLIRMCTIIFGLCAIAFGFNHFFNMSFTAAMVPAWIPPDQWSWALATGIAHVLAGLAILSGYFARVASKALTLMFVLFGVLIWIPQLLTNAGAPITWTGNAVNLALVGAAWIIAEAVDLQDRARRAVSSGYPEGARLRPADL